MKNFIHKIKWGIVSVGLFFTAGVVYGDTGYTTCGKGEGLTNPLNACSIAELVENIAKLAAQIGIPIAAIFIIYSGLLFVTARGNEEQLKKAKTNFMWAMIGTAILLGAWVIAKAISETIKGF